MKKHSLIIVSVLLMVILGMASCGKDNDGYKAFIGTWGVQKIEYYNIDYQGNPIAASMETFNFDPQDVDDGIQLIFRDDKTGEMRDNNIDTVWYDWNAEEQVYESYVVNPDTTLLTKFTFSYDKDAAILYMNMSYHRTFQMRISNLTSDAFVYENEYDENYVERAYMVRLNDEPTKSASRKHIAHPNKPGSFLGSSIY